MRVQLKFRAHKFTACVLRSFALPDHSGSTSSCKLNLHQAPYTCILTSCHKCFCIILVFASLLRDKNLLRSPVMCQKRHDENFEFQMCSQTGFKFTCLSSLKNVKLIVLVCSQIFKRRLLLLLWYKGTIKKNADPSRYKYKHFQHQKNTPISQFQRLDRKYG